jgi:hypothetical protein
MNFSFCGLLVGPICFFVAIIWSICDAFQFNHTHGPTGFAIINLGCSFLFYCLAICLYKELRTFRFAFVIFVQILSPTIFLPLYLLLSIDALKSISLIFLFFGLIFNGESVYFGHILFRDIHVYSNL